jgi:tetratricopeptide (TPR) repeat protein
LQIAPNHFQSLFFLGKIYQRMEKYEAALSYLERALEIERENFSIPQEASLVAMHLNLIDKAIKYSNEALKRNPNNVVLMGNHAMNLLIAGKDKEAKAIIDKAVNIDPNDHINKNILNKIDNVMAGKSPRPTFKEAL